MRFFWCILSALQIVSYLSGGHALLEQCPSGQGDCDAREPYSVCVGGNCSCTETHREIENNCTAKTCTTANVAANCGTNLYCTSDGVCACAATYEILPDGRSCTSKTCTASNPTSCATADSNSYCDTALSSPACKCKMNYDQPNTKNCTIKACGTNADCTVTNAYCETGTNAGCTCGIISSADSTTGACRSKTCEVSAAISSEASCGAMNSFCELSRNAYQCACGANYEPGAASCTQKACTAATVANDCDPDSICINDRCECKSGFVASGSLCKKSCTRTSDCSSSAGCINSVCECFGNFEGNGETCTAMTCAGTDTTTCRPNSVCTSSVCTCATGYVANATACFKMCNASSDCSTNGQCIDGECTCNTYFVGDGLKCTQKSCSQNSECKTWSNSICTSGRCVAGQQSCTAANTSTCARADINSFCDTSLSSPLCKCKVNYNQANEGTGATKCTQRACTTATVANDCGSDSVCTNSLCECKSGFVASGSRCKKSCTSTNDCSINAGCISNICECFGNFEGNGETCTAIACSGVDNTTCHPNSVCINSVCTCAAGYVAKATACFEKCNASSDCSSNGKCTDGECTCNKYYVGDGLECTQKSCTQNSECKTWSNSVCTSGKCVAGAITVAYSFTFMLFAFLTTFFFGEM